MALFVDGNPSQVADWTTYESSILDVAKTEGIDLAAKASVASLEIGLELQRFLVRTAGGAAYGLTNIVSTGALRQWHIVYGISITYRDAHSQQLNDRYRQKWEQYEKLALKASELLYQVGIGIVAQPVPRPGPPVLRLAAGPLAAQTWYASVTWVLGDGTESAPSEAAAITSQEGSVLTVRAAFAPEHVVGWNVYTGSYGDTLLLQSPLPLGLSNVWTMPPQGESAGRAPGNGQSPDLFLRRSNILLRG